MHGRIHDGIVLSGVLSLWVPTFINVMQHVFGCTMRVLVSLWVALLCLLIHRLFICLFV